MTERYRLNRAIAATGHCSRRKADEYIEAGRVTLNGKVTTDFNVEVDFANDELAIDGRKISVKKYEYILLNKPTGVLSTCSDELQRRNVLDLLPASLRHLRPIGRLDMDSEGMLLLTNDGDFANLLMHPSHEVFKRYEVCVEGTLSDGALQQMRSGMLLDDGPTLPAKVRLIQRDKRKSIFEISIREGRNRQIRRMCAKVGHPVQRLVRVAIGELQLRQMEPGSWRHLTVQEVQMLRSK